MIGCALYALRSSKARRIASRRSARRLAAAFINLIEQKSFGKFTRNLHRHREALCQMFTCVFTNILITIF